jgi:hypothetical protein
MRADSTAGKEERVPIPNGADGPLVVSLSDLSNIQRDVYLGRAGLPARGKALIFLIEME